MRRRKRAVTAEIQLTNTNSDDQISPIFTHRMVHFSPILSLRNYRHISATPASTVDRLGSLVSITNVSNTMVESPLSQRKHHLGNNLSANTVPSTYTKSANEYNWYHETPATIHTNTATSFDDCLPRLEIDEKPLIYRQQFEPTEHFNWYGISDNHGPVIISYKYSNEHDKQRYVMAIVRTRQQTSIESVLDVSSCLSSIEILRRICDQCAITDIEYFDPVLCDGAHDLLIKYDESHVSTKHKFGIIYQRENQLTEEDIFSNETHSVAMENFLNLIGEHVKLKDFQGFRGGLDVKTDQTGTESVYEQFNNHEIMFHVSTLLPHSKIERQQLERKRHIGNDIVAVIFQEADTVFNPECITSQFLHAYLVVTPLDTQGTSFKISVIHRESVPSFGPVLPHSNIFHCDNRFKQWILTKLINAEMASCRANSFQKYQERTKMTLFDNLYQTLHDTNRPFMNFVLNHSQYKHECDVEQQQREDVQTLTSPKTYDRHSDNSLLGSVRRRFITPKLRSQQSTTPPPSSINVLSTSAPNNNNNNANDLKPKLRSMTMDLKRSGSKELMTSKNCSPRMERSNTNRSLLDTEFSDLSLSSRSNSRFLSPTTPLNDFNSNDDGSLFPTSFDFTKLSIDDPEQDNQSQSLIDNLHSSSKEDLIKCIIALQQQHSTKLAQVNQIHSKTIRQLEMKFFQQRHPRQNTFDGEGL